MLKILITKKNNEIKFQYNNSILKSDTNELNEIPLAFLFSKIISGNKSENGVPFKFFFQFFKNIILKGLCLTHK